MVHRRSNKMAPPNPRHTITPLTGFGETGSLRPHEQECFFMYTEDKILTCADCG